MTPIRAISKSFSSIILVISVFVSLHLVEHDVHQASEQQASLISDYQKCAAGNCSSLYSDHAAQQNRADVSNTNTDWSDVGIG